MFQVFTHFFGKGECWFGEFPVPWPIYILLALPPGIIVGNISGKVLIDAPRIPVFRWEGSCYGWSSCWSSRLLPVSTLRGKRPGWLWRRCWLMSDRGGTVPTIPKPPISEYFWGCRSLQYDPWINDGCNKPERGYGRVVLGILWPDEGFYRVGLSSLLLYQEWWHDTGLSN